MQSKVFVGELRSLFPALATDFYYETIVEREKEGGKLFGEYSTELPVK